MRQSIILEMERMRFPIYRRVAVHTFVSFAHIGDKMISMLILSGVVRTRNKNKALAHCLRRFHFHTHAQVHVIKISRADLV